MMKTQRNFESTHTDRKKSIQNLRILVLTLSFCAGALIIFQLIGEPALANYEEPTYKVILKKKDFEVREYEKKLAAEVEIKGNQRTAMNRGFRILASYIFGKNVSQNKIEMTSPVVAQPSTKIAMTSPVVVKPGKKMAMTSPVTAGGGDGTWKITFYMPSKFSLETLPKPIDSRISISEVPGETYAVQKFSGRWSKENFDKHRQELSKLLTQSDIQVTGEPVNAYYDPPFTLPMFRRNEVMIPVAVTENPDS